MHEVMIPKEDFMTGLEYLYKGWRGITVYQRVTTSPYKCIHHPCNLLDRKFLFNILNHFTGLSLSFYI